MAQSVKMIKYGIDLENLRLSTFLILNIVFFFRDGDNKCCEECK